MAKRSLLQYFLLHESFLCREEVNEVQSTWHTSGGREHYGCRESEMSRVVKHSPRERQIENTAHFF